MSLKLRIILSASLVLATFITLTAAALNSAFIDSTESALRDRLTSQLYALIAAAELEADNTLIMPSSELDALLGLPSSGVYAYISDKSGQVLWQSSSVLGANIPQAVVLPSGEKFFSKTQVDNNDFYIFAYGISWATELSNTQLTFNIITDLQSFNNQISEYRTTLWGWLMAMAVFLLISQAIILQWGLLPLRRVGSELNRIESGEQEQIEETYPVEINRLTSNINLLLQQERKQKTRYRNALGDLAHSLKTPLAVLQSNLNNSTSTKENTDETMQQQITRMNSIVEYQLQRAATAGSSRIGKSINLQSTIERILDSLQKVYRDKSIELDLTVDESLQFKGDEGDLMELLGNLLDNAFKWTSNRINILVTKRQNNILIRITDNGPGIDQKQLGNISQRGVRADQSTAGHGIGLSIVYNIVEAYEGTITIENNPGGGLQVEITL